MFPTFCYLQIFYVLLTLPERPQIIWNYSAVFGENLVCRQSIRRATLFTRTISAKTSFLFILLPCSSGASLRFLLSHNIFSFFLHFVIWNCIIAKFCSLLDIVSKVGFSLVYILNVMNIHIFRLFPNNVLKPFAWT